MGVYLEELVDDSELVLATEYSYVKYPFKHFNKLQSTIIKNGFHKKDDNLVLGTKTSTGKTIASELMVGDTLFKKNKKVIYVGPLKALSSEKVREWTETYPTKKVALLTSDATNGKNPALLKRELELADIICMTSEMLDSKTRTMSNNLGSWLYGVGAIVLDEFHIIGTERGSALEVGLMRVTENIDCQLIALSATLPNMVNIQNWFTTLNGRDTNCINSDWRPVTLSFHFPEHKVNGSYADKEASKIAEAVKIIESKPTEKFLVFAHSMASGNAMVQAVNEPNVHFHNSKATKAQRTAWEADFDNPEGDCRVLVATSTLAWGVNLPARNVIILGTTRGLNDVDELDIIQEAGRAGRPGKTDKGDVYLICPDAQSWMSKITNPRDAKSQLISESELGFHILAEVNIGTISCLKSFNDWYLRSLASIQVGFSEGVAQSTIDILINIKMLRVGRAEKLIVTELGKISSDLYLPPRQLSLLDNGFSFIDDNELWEDDISLSWAVGVGFDDKDYISSRDAYKFDKFINLVLERGFYNCNIISPLAMDVYDRVVGAVKHPMGTLSGLIFDISRTAQVLYRLDSLHRWESRHNITTFITMIEKGVLRQYAELCLIDSVGPVTAMKLAREGLTCVTDLANSANVSVMQSTIGRHMGMKIHRSAVDFLNQGE